MIIAGVALLMVVQSGGSPFDRVTPEVAAQRVSECGMGTVTIRFDELLQSEVLVAASAPSAASDEQLACADKAASYYDLELPPAVQTRYEAIRQERLSAHFLAEARAWLAARGLLDRVPQYQAGVTSDAEFARAVEDLCGPRAKGALHSEYGFHAISPDWVKRELSPLRTAATDTLACITNVARVAGYELHFIGNMAPAEPQ